MNAYGCVYVKLTMRPGLARTANSTADLQDTDGNCWSKDERRKESMTHDGCLETKSERPD